MNRPIIERTDDAPDELDTEVLDETIPHSYCRNAQVMPNGTIRCSLTNKFVSNPCENADYDYEKYIEDLEAMGKENYYER